MTSQLDDISTTPVVPPPGQDPLDVFRHPDLPRWALVHRTLDATAIDDVAGAVHAAFEPVVGSVQPGMRVAVAAGSRGIDRIDEVVAAIVGEIRAAGGQPFVIPAMGSHGGATSEGQLEVLASLGITPERIGCEIRASMDTVLLGEVEDGVPVYVDRIAFEQADAIVPVNRVKPHTDFTGPVESGLLKMIAIGLSKQKGADTFHARGFDAFAELIPKVAAFTLAHVPIPFGIALVENGYARLNRIEAIPAAGMDARERVLRDEADGYLARLPLAQLDVLVLDRIGKDISGLGMDSNVVGRYYTGPTGRGTSIQRIFLRDLTDETEGNAVGIGMADVVHARAVARMDATKTYMNCVTAKTPEGARVALTAATDRQGLDLALACCLRIEPARARIARILDTKHLEWFFASEPLLQELRDRGDCELRGEPAAMRFDEAGEFIDALPA
ncbi:MAG TPA: lactate racemase domain-containing protein [Candidatus Limnocylindria bacterium]|nr:lactate racemase domain-containing protein [Candidatus Limnocylindria bacterium]